MIPPMVRPALALCLVLAGVAAAAAPSAALAQAHRAGGPDVDAALRFLSQHQRDDGSFGKSNQLALTAMCGLAFLSSGSTPLAGPYAQQVPRAVRWILDQQRPSGAFTHGSNGYSDIHNHGFALLLLAECYGMTRFDDPADEARLRSAIQRGIRVSVESQTENGGFSYFLFNDSTGTRFPEMMRDDEASTTVAQVQALRAARNAGFAVPPGAIERALAYLAACQHRATGGFIYSLAQHRVSAIEGSKVPTFAITAASLCALEALGTYRGERFEQGVAYLRRFQPPKREAEFYYYGHYYAAQVMFLRDDPAGAAWLAAVLADLAARQGEDGGFAKGGSTLDPTDDAILGTAWAVQIATIRRGCLPLFAH